MYTYRIPPQTLANIEICNIVQGTEDIKIKITKRLKTSGLNRMQPTLLLPFFNTEPSVCVARCLQEHLNKTVVLRNNQCNLLLITFKKPYKNAKVNTVSRWIKVVLAKSGLDTSIFTAHSTRHASTSAAARSGVSMDVIRLAAGWSQNSETFANFYQRPIVKDSNFAQAALGI